MPYPHLHLLSNFQNQIFHQARHLLNALGQLMFNTFITSPSLHFLKIFLPYLITWLNPLRKKRILSLTKFSPSTSMQSFNHKILPILSLKYLLIYHLPSFLYSLLWLAPSSHTHDPIKIAASNRLPYPLVCSLSSPHIQQNYLLKHNVLEAFNSFQLFITKVPNFKVRQGLLKQTQIAGGDISNFPIQQDWEGAQESAFPTSS